MYFQKRLWHLWAWLAYRRAFPEKIPYVLSMYGHVKHCHIGHVVSRQKFKSFYQVSCKDIIVTLVILFPDYFSKMLACMHVVVILIMLFPENIFLVLACIGLVCISAICFQKRFLEYMCMVVICFQKKIKGL